MCDNMRHVLYINYKFFLRKFILEGAGIDLHYVEQLTETKPLPGDVFWAAGSTQGWVDALNERGLWFRQQGMSTDAYILFATVTDEEGNYVP